MRSSLPTVLTVAALALGTGCANARLRAARQAAPTPTEAKPKDAPKRIQAVWVNAEGERVGRKSSRPGGEAGDKAAQETLVTERPSGRTAYPNAESPLGTNLAPIGPDSRDWVFVDVFRMAAPWQIEKDGTGGRTADTLDQDKDGWVPALAPGQSVVTQLPTCGGGRFVMLYKGRGDLRLRGARVVKQTPGRLTYEAPPRSTVSVVIANTNPANYIREIHVVPADFEATFQDQVFHPLFIQRLSRFSVLRFTDWLRAADAAAPTWPQRSTLSTYTQGGPRGVAYEYIAMLANELGTDVWLSVPHRANDKYVEELGAFFTDRLDPDLKVYLEYGAGFERPDSEASRYAAKQGQFMGLDPDSGRARLEYQVRRSLDVFARFATRFDTRRTFRVLSGPVGDSDRLRALLAYRNASKQVDLLAVAPFVGVEVENPERLDALSGMEASDILDALEFTTLPAVMSQVRAAQRIVAEFDLGLVAYSGGGNLTVRPSLRGGRGLNAVFDQVSRHPRSGAIYAALLSGWADAGGELFVHAPLIAGLRADDRTAALEYQDQGPDQAPRYEALMSFAQNRERWWGKRRPEAPKIDPNAVASGPSGPDLSAQTTPEERGRSGAIWGASGAGLAAATAGAIFAGLYLKSTATRDRFVADNPFPGDGQEGRDADDAAFRYSLAFTTSFSLAAVGFGSAIVLDLIDEVGYEGVNPGVAIGAGTGLVALASSAAFLIAYLNTLSERQNRLELDPNPADAFPLRNLDEEAFRWSLGAATSLGVSVASFALALSYYLIDAKDPYVDSYLDAEGEARGSTDGVDVMFAPNGFMLKW